MLEHVDALELRACGRDARAWRVIDRAHSPGETNVEKLAVECLTGHVENADDLGAEPAHGRGRCAFHVEHHLVLRDLFPDNLGGVGAARGSQLGLKVAVRAGRQRAAQRRARARHRGAGRRHGACLASEADPEPTEDLPAEPSARAHTAREMSDLFEQWETSRGQPAQVDEFEGRFQQPAPQEQRQPAELVDGASPAPAASEEGTAALFSLRRTEWPIADRRQFAQSRSVCAVRARARARSRAASFVSPSRVFSAAARARAQVAVANSAFAVGTLECSVIRWQPGTTETPIGAALTRHLKMRTWFASTVARRGARRALARRNRHLAARGGQHPQPVYGSDGKPPVRLPSEW